MTHPVSTLAASTDRLARANDRLQAVQAQLNGAAWGLAEAEAEPDTFTVPMDTAARLADCGPLGRETRRQFAKELRDMGAKLGTLVLALDPDGDVAATVSL